MTHSLKDMVKGDKKVTFTHYKAGDLWYVTDCGFEFPVPVSDIGPDASFMASDRAMLFMRYIRKHLDMLREAQAEFAE